MADLDSRRGQILAAIKALKPKADAPIDFIIGRIEWMLDEAPHAVDVLPVTPKEAAKELDRLAAAVNELAQASQALSRPAMEALNEAKFRRNLTWAPSHSKWSQGRDVIKAISDSFPEIEAVAAEGAAKLRSSGARQRRIKAYPLALATTLAGWFEALTGDPPPRGRGESNRFVGFVETIFNAAAISASSDHYAALGADAHAKREGENPPEIRWVRSSTP